jgi:hypothetical protein
VSVALAATLAFAALPACHGVGGFAGGLALQASLSRTKLHGEVHHPDGTPAAGVPVRVHGLYFNVFVWNTIPTTSPVGKTVTDASGHFTCWVSPHNRYEFRLGEGATSTRVEFRPAEHGQPLRFEIPAVPPASVAQ